MAADLEANPKKLRTRSPAYPYLDLRSALDKAATLLAAEGRHPAAVNVVMHHWGYKEESSTGYSCMAALKKFGLIDLDGVGENKLVRLSSLALAILLDANPDSPERAEALRTAAMSPRIHAELWERYGSNLPSDPSLKRFLVLEKSFNEAAVDELLAEYKQTVVFAGLSLTPAPSIGAGAFTPAAVAAAAKGDFPAAGAGRFGDAAGESGAEPAAPALPLPPPRAIGPASGVRREAGGFNAPQRGLSAREEAFGEPVPLPGADGGNDRRRESGGGSGGGYPVGNRPRVEREPARYDQDSFGYGEEDRYDDGGGRSPVRGGFSPAEDAAASMSGGGGVGGGRGGPSRANPAGGGGPGIANLPGLVAPGAFAPAGMAAGAAAAETDTPSEVPRKELPVPLDGDRVALVPYPMTEEDFSLLIATLQLWKKRLVR